MHPTDGLADAMAFIEAHQRFVIASHMDPDGDSLGSSLALAMALRQTGRSCRVVIGQPLPDRYRWLPGADEVETASSAPADCGAVILVECSDFARSGLSELQRWPSLNIDHHTQNALYGEVNWIDPSVAAVGMMVGRLLGELQTSLTPEIANLLYVTVLTDTGSFHHSNADAAAFRFAGDMVAAGAVPETVAAAVYGDVPAGQVQLMGDALASLRIEHDGEVAWMRLRPQAFDSRGTTDTEGVINHAQGIAGVRVSVLFKEARPGVFRTSLRSDGSVDVAEIAAAHGGGGHPRAAGCRLLGDFSEIRATLMEPVVAALERARSGSR